MSNNSYAYAVARVHAREAGLLTDGFIEQLLSEPSMEAALKLLRDKGWGDEKTTDPRMILSLEREKTWEFLRELLDDPGDFDIFLYEIDYHNLKAAIKQARIKFEFPDIYIEDGSIDVETIKHAVKNREFTELPEHVRETAKEAYDIYMRTGDGQLLDITIDHALLTAIYNEGKKSKTAFIKLYAKMMVAVADIKIAIRSVRTEKNRDFLERALVECDSLDKHTLIQTVEKGEDAVIDYLESTSYADAVPELKNSPSAFERWCDNYLIRKMKREKYEVFGLGPLAAYYLARENEIKTVRIILGGKQNGFSEEALRERVREMYV